MKRSRTFFDFISWLIIVGAFLTAAHGAFAQEATTTSGLQCPTENARHVLNGHAYLPSLYLPDEFVDTRANLAMIFGYGNFDSTLFGTPNNLKVGAFSGDVNFQLAFTEWLAINVGYTGHAVAGLNGDSAIQYGASTAYAWSAGGLVRLIRTDEFYLSLGFDLVRPHINSVSPLDLQVQSVQHYVGSTAPAFPSNGVETEYIPSLRMAYALGPVIGLRGLFGFNFQSGENLATRRTGNRMLLGLGMSFDLNPAISIPVGFTANYRRSQIIQGGASNINVYELGLYETVSTRLNMGVEIGLGNTDGVTTTSGAAVARAYFN